MNKLDFLILFLHLLTGNENWMDGNKLTTASAYYGSYEGVLEGLQNNNLGFDLASDKSYFYEHLGTTEDELKQLSIYEIEYEGDFSRGTHIVNIDLGFGDDVKILKRSDREVYFVRFNPSKLYNETINITKESTVTESNESSANNSTDDTNSNDNKNILVPQNNLSVSKQNKKDILISLGIFATILGFTRNLK